MVRFSFLCIFLVDNCLSFCLFFLLAIVLSVLRLKVDLYFGCDSDATSNKICNKVLVLLIKLLRWRSDTIAKSLFFCCVATIAFSSYCLVILIILIL